MVEKTKFAQLPRLLKELERACPTKAIKAVSTMGEQAGQWVKHWRRRMPT